jgi:UPF0176 protein
VQCLHCIDQFSDDDRARFAMRQRQIDQNNTSAVNTAAFNIV